MKLGLAFIFSVFLIFSTFGQEDEEVKKDTTQLKEIKIVGRQKLSNYRQEKTLSSVDNYLEKANKITMIKRGNYAWEPTINNMNSERLSVTIDGMQIFGACTDKMDPITSYVDVSNLQTVTVGSGQSGSEHGHTIGGGIDLQLNRSRFNQTGLKSSVDLGYESNGNYRTGGLDFEYSGASFFFDVDGIFRKSDNYKAGDHQEVLFSQFQKYNIALQTGFKLNDHHVLNANIIYDKATNIGYPALTMDVSLAEAVIAAVSHNYSNEHSFIQTLESKIYFNSITHVMDDSQRPLVAIRMDMPGWSDTFGFYSKAGMTFNNHKLTANLNGYYNKSLAEMTMYPNDPNQSAMFMYTWPDIRTLYSGLFVKEIYNFNEQNALSASVRFGFHQNEIAEKTGLESLQIFYSDVEKTKNRFLSSFNADYQIKRDHFDISFGGGYGERVPSVSEGYGFFLFNSFDNYDYIGNPILENEKALEVNLKSNFHSGKFHIGFDASYFHITDYIIGTLDPGLSAMTIGAKGVKKYGALSYASIFDVYINASYKLLNNVSVNGTVGYNYGKGSDEINLPLIKPFSYLAEINYAQPHFNVALQWEGNGNQTQYSKFYGEDQTPGYGVFYVNFGNQFQLFENQTVVKYGVENVLDIKYSTYADWNNIPRQGRNFYVNLSYILQ